MLATPRVASHVHGEDGLGGLVLPATNRVAEPVSAVELLRRTLMESDEPVTLVALAPQTNLALLLRTHPEVVDRIERIVFMGGSASVGNATAVAEFNVWHDPEAAAIVLGSGIPTFMYGLDVFNQVTVDQDRAAALASGPSKLGAVVGALLSNRVALSEDRSLVYTGLIGDAGAICALVDPDALRIERRPVRVELAGYGRGQTVVDRRRFSGEDAIHGGVGDWTPIDVALDVDAPRYARLFLGTLGFAD
jgi:pyrimidine-specific ribonucleoside hydrolase